ncbi:LysR substrate-binding domain-containing protein [Streptomyces sp. KR80]|uniref:LysR substrate-binding domain-containing protein n=1 Tax=Streptomyces sp. KR80 TaxID=3457426 RepID=UPI003FD04417
MTLRGWYKRMLDICRRGGFVPTRIRHAGSPEFLLGLVTAGLGVAFEQDTAARREPRVVWRPLAGRPLVRETSAAWPSVGAHPGARRFADLAAGVFARAAAPSARSLEPVPEDRPLPWSVVYAPLAPAEDGSHHTRGS